MAVHVVLSRDQIRSILSLYHLDALEDFGGIPEGSVNASYWVRVAGRKYLLRITEKKRTEDMIFEKELLLQLHRSGLPVPRLVRNVAKGTFTPWAARGRFVSLFEYLPGRELGLFEVRARQTKQIGQFTAQLARAAEGFSRNRDLGQSLGAIQRKVRRLVGALEKRRLARRYAEDVHLLAEEVEGQRTRPREALPRAAIHGALFVDNARFEAGELASVIDFERSCTDACIVDLAVALNAWTWLPSPEQTGGPAGSYDGARFRALIAGYQSVRPLSEEERAALPAELRLAAARFAASRLVTYELERGRSTTRKYEDYRHHMARLRALSGDVAERLVQRAS